MDCVASEKTLPAEECRQAFPAKVGREGELARGDDTNRSGTSLPAWNLQNSGSTLPQSVYSQRFCAHRQAGSKARHQERARALFASADQVHRLHREIEFLCARVRRAPVWMPGLR